MGIIAIFVVCLICAWIGAYLAAEKGRKWAGFWLGLGFGPLGIIIALLLPTKVASRELESSAELSADFQALIQEKGKTGIALNQRDGRTIDAVLPGSAADEAGVISGDRIIAINGELCSGGYKEVVLRLVGEKGSPLSITVRRGESRVDIDLVRR